MAQTNINVRIDEELKKQFDELCENLGLTITSAITLFAKSSVREQALSVSLSLDPFYSKANMDRLMKAKERMETTGGTEHPLMDE